MSFLSALPIVGDIIKSVLAIIDQAVEDKDQANKLKAELALRFAEMDFSRDVQQLQAQASIIRAEAQGESWLQRNWRPLLMLAVVAIVVNNYLIYPYLRLFWPEAPVLELPPELFTLLTVGVGGYVVGRSGEKVMDRWSAGRVEQAVASAQAAPVQTSPAPAASQARRSAPPLPPRPTNDWMEGGGDR